MDKVENGVSVTLHYTGKFEDGEIFDTSIDTDPITVGIGENKLIPGFERNIVGMVIGEKKNFEVLPNEGYGEEHTSLIQEIPLEQMPEGVKVGDVLSTKTTEGIDLNVMVEQVNETTATVNANHPLSGKKLLFEVEIVSIV